MEFPNLKKRAGGGNNIAPNARSMQTIKKAGFNCIFVEREKRSSRPCVDREERR